MPRLVLGLAILTCALVAALVFARPDIIHFLSTEVSQLRVLVRNPADPSGLIVTLRLPVEGRELVHLAHDRVTILVVPSDLAEPVLFSNLVLDGSGTVRVALPESVFLPDGTEVTIAVKTTQTLRRVVHGSAQRGTLTIDLGNTSTYREDENAHLRGAAYLPVGDIEGSGGDLHDNVIDAFDVGAWTRSFREENRSAPADLNGNGAVGAEDLSLLLRHFNARGDTIPTTLL